MHVRPTVPMIAMTLLTPVSAAIARDGDARVAVGAVVVVPCSVMLTSEPNVESPEDGSPLVDCPASHQPSVETFRIIDAAQVPTEPLPSDPGKPSTPEGYQLAEIIF